jgi:hypothetical protein
MVPFLQKAAYLAAASLSGDPKVAESAKSHHFLNKISIFIKPASSL